MDRVVLIKPNGSVKIVNADIRNLFRDEIECRTAEVVYTILDNIIMLVDEEGAICEPRKDFNYLASTLCRGDFVRIYGNAVICKTTADDIVGLSKEEADIFKLMLES